jgi:hypothetical protein
MVHDAITKQPAPIRVTTDVSVLLDANRTEKVQIPIEIVPGARS